MSATPRRTVHRPALVVLVVVLAVAALALGWWQWERFSSASGTAQNLGYALQWPLFAGFALYAYFRFVRLEQESGPGAPGTTVSTALAGPDAPAETVDEVRPAGSRAKTGLFTGRRDAPAYSPREIPAGFLPERPRAARDDDPVLAEYNSYLARLNADDGVADRPAGAARETERSAG
ncbi:transcriptional regulator [Nocardia sp. NBC_01329]|uniref:transcriptional regulator n=1 Tax=Nocardia sp. NBC_01329 TaxID=2903594 RepID=UPI002E13ACE0|nr:transcriptional regulator [Nocardia sp. NBC_01329]